MNWHLDFARMPLALRPSPNELARIEKQQAEAARIERLQKVRWSTACG
jgi:hypothetical protein